MTSHFFSFPKDNKIRKEWIMKCKRNDKFNPDTSRICSDHFEKHKFLRDLKGELTKNLKSKVNEEVQKTLGHFLTKNQIKMLTEEKKYIHCLQKKLL